MSTRPSWPEYFMQKAEHAATMSTCERLKVGAVLVKNDVTGRYMDLMTAYNGSLPGHPHCTDEGVGCLIHEGGCKRTIHAEMNIIDRCARFGISTEGAILYVTHYPCPTCMQHISNVGIRRVIYKHYYKHRFENNFHYGLEIHQCDSL